jgi:hypothetical protein
VSEGISPLLLTAAAVSSHLRLLNRSSRRTVSRTHQSPQRGGEGRASSSQTERRLRFNANYSLRSAGDRGATSDHQQEQEQEQQEVEEGGDPEEKSASARPTGSSSRAEEGDASRCSSSGRPLRKKKFSDEEESNPGASIRTEDQIQRRARSSSSAFPEVPSPSCHR